jgi:hypothetical protein
MVVRIALQDIQASKGLVHELIGLFGGPRISLKTNGEIQVEHASDRAILQVLDAVGRQLEGSGVSTTRLWVDERRYMLEGSERPKRLSEPGRTRRGTRLKLQNQTRQVAVRGQGRRADG